MQFLFLHNSVSFETMKYQQGILAENGVKRPKVNFNLQTDSLMVTRLWSVLLKFTSFPPIPFDNFMKTVPTPWEIHIAELSERKQDEDSGKIEQFFPA